MNFKDMWYGKNDKEGKSSKKKKEKEVRLTSRYLNGDPDGDDGIDEKKKDDDEDLRLTANFYNND